MTNEDINNDTKYTINENDMNKHDARDLHEWAQQHVVSRLSCLVDNVSWSSLAQVHWVFHLTSSACRTCVVVFDSLRPLSLYFNLSFTVFFLSSVLMFPDLQTDLHDPDSVENDLRHSAKESLDAYDVTHSLTGYEPNDTELNDTVSNELVYSQGHLAYVTPSSDQDIDDTTLGKLLTEAHREYADYLSLEGVFVSQSSVSVASDRTGKPVGENSSNAQIRTLFNELREMIIAECCEKISHHELQAARAEQDRQILQEDLRRQQKDFREVHQQNLTEMEELRKF